MLNRRSFLGGLSASMPVIVLPGRVRAQAARPRLHAMIVGINTYTGRDARGPIRELKGCINDANDIAAQVTRLGASVRVLGAKDEPVTRDMFSSTWQEMMAAARERDTLLLTFSGHGFQVPEGIKGNERDGMDETLVLTGYSTSDPRNSAQHIIDDELERLFRAAHARQLNVVFVSDSCHSGTVFRTVELADIRYRTLRPQDFARAGPAAVPGPASQEDPPNLLFLAGAQENELVPEITVGGQWRGALSVAVARALEGGADTNRDGIITAGELADFTLSYVQSLSDSGQHPDVRWHSPTRSTPADAGGLPAATQIIRLRQLSESPSQTKDVPVVIPEPGPVRLRILGLEAADQRRIVTSLTNATLVGEREPASLIWDAGRQLVLNDQGHRIAEGVDAGQLQHAVDRRRALERLIRMSAGQGVAVRILLPGERPDAPPSVAADATHRPGATFAISITGVRDAYFYTVFNLTGNGQVEMLEPYPGDPPNFNRPEFRTGMRKDRGASAINIGGVVVKKQGPFGAEHVVVVAGARPLSRLMPALVDAHGKFAVAGAMAALAREAAAQQPLQAGFKGIYSARG